VADDTIRIDDPVQDLDAQLDAIGAEIHRLRAQRAELHEKRRLTQVSKLREKYGVKVVCSECLGHGEHAPVDIAASGTPCGECDGHGYLWEVQFPVPKTLSAADVEAIRGRTPDYEDSCGRFDPFEEDETH